MTRLRRTGIAVLAGACCLAFGRGAPAEEAEPVHLTYDAPAQCPGESAFLDRVARNGGRLVPVPDDVPARSFVVQIRGTDTVYGRLAVRKTDGPETMRELRDGDCSVVVSALALLAAISVTQPLATQGDLPLPPPPSPPAPQPEETLPAVPGLAAGPLPSEASASEYDDPRPSVPRPQGLRIDVSAEGTLSTGAMPWLDPGFAAYVELLDENPSFLAPSIRLGAEISEDQQNTLGNAVVRRFVARLDACSFRTVMSVSWSDQTFTLEPCVRIDAGRIGVQSWLSSPMPTPDNAPVTLQGEAARPWVAPAGLLRLRWTSPSVFVEIEGGVTVPLIRDHFIGYTLDFTVPPIGATTGIGFGFYIFDAEPHWNRTHRTQAGR